MKHLIIFAHPNQKIGLDKSFGRSILDSLVELDRQLEVETVVRDLYQMEFDPILRQEELQATYQGIIPTEIQFEQTLIRDADLVTLIYPLWWMGFPAILKGYLDRVLSQGFAYKTDANGSEGLLAETQLQQFITMGSDTEQYRQSGFLQSLDHCLGQGLFNFCGITHIEVEVFGRIHNISSQERQTMINTATEKTKAKLIALSHQK